jgi:hypothetical protein
MKLLLEWWRSLWCEHYWRPGKYSYRRTPTYVAYSPLVKYCHYCHKVVGINPEQFYRQFGQKAF